MSSPYDVSEIWQIVERVAKSRSKAVTPGEAEMLTWLRNTLGTKKPLQEYAPRTRRRYKAASREGQTARQRNKQEYQQRTGGTPKTPRGGPRNRMQDLIDRRNQFFPRDPVDVQDVQDYVAAFGYDNVITILQEQIDSCEWWLRNDPRPGHNRWFNRRHEVLRPDFTSYISNTDIFYFYHARRN